MLNIPLESSEIIERLGSLTGWEWEDEKLVKSFEFKDFRCAMSFLFRVSYEAEQRDHHPEIFNCYNKVRFFLNTHDAGGKVTAKDFALAEAIEAVV